MTIVILLVFASVVLLGLGALSLPSRSPERRRLERLVDGTTANITAPADEDSVLADQKGGWIARLLAPLAGRAGAEPSRGPIRQRLIRAGYRSESAVTVYMGGRIVLAVLLPVLFAVSPFAWGLDQLRLVMAMIVASAVGYVLPSYWVGRRERARQRQITIGLPDALDLMVVCVEAGLGINASLQRVSEEFSRTNPVLSAEFEMVTLETRAGKSTTQALKALSERTGVSDVSSLVAMLVQTERFGTSLADTLRIHADAMRTQRLQRAEELAAKAPLKMLFPMVIIFVATLLVTIGPGMLQIFQFFAGNRP
jgi:tight adherence protein C